MAKSRKMPWTKWFFPDWRKDAGVRSVSLEARGFWMEMLSLMDESPRRGFLLAASGKRMSAEQLARNAGCSTDDASRLFRELQEAGVFSISDDGFPFSRRMVRDERIRKVRSEAGLKGGNPLLCLSKTQAKGKQTRGSPSVLIKSSNSESSSEELSLPFESDEFLQAWNQWWDYRRERKLANWKPVTLKAKFAELASWGEAASIESIRQAIANGWQGLFEPKANARGTQSPTAVAKSWAERRRERRSDGN